MVKRCFTCNLDKDIIEFPKIGAKCRKCKAEYLRNLRLNDHDYYIKRKKYRNENKDKINIQKKSSYIKNAFKVKQVNNKYYHDNIEHCRKRQKNYQIKRETSSIESWLAKCMKHSKSSDKKHNRTFDLSLKYLIDLYNKQDGRCAISNVVMTYNRNDLFAASIDRINVNNGHVVGNVQLVCQAVNLAKREYANHNIYDFLKASTVEITKSHVVPDFVGFDYPESTAHYSFPRKEAVIIKLRNLFKLQFIPPTYTKDELNNDYNRIKDIDYLEYTWRMFKPDNKPFAGKKIIWNFQPHLWNVRCQNKSTINEIWGKGDMFEKALWNLVNGQTKISFDRIIRELIFAGAAVPSQMHPGFAKTVYSFFKCEKDDIVYDPFAGWGGRLLAASSLGLKYIGCELSKPTYAGLINMSNYCNLDCKLHNCDFRTIKADAKFMFTSPPFGSEQYLESNERVNITELLDITSNIERRVLHVNEVILNEVDKSKIKEVIPVLSKGQASGSFSNEYLILI